MAGSPYEIAVQALYKTSLGKIYARDLLAKSLQQDLYNVAVPGLGKTCPGKTSVQDLYKRSLSRSL